MFSSTSWPESWHSRYKTQTLLKCEHLLVTQPWLSRPTLSWCISAGRVSLSLLVLSRSQAAEPARVSGVRASRSNRNNVRQNLVNVSHEKRPHQQPIRSLKADSVIRLERRNRPRCLKRNLFGRLVWRKRLSCENLVLYFFFCIYIFFCTLYANRNFDCGV